MISKRTNGRFFGVLLATMYAGLITSAVRFWFGLHIAATLLIFIGFWTGFYFAGLWAMVDRPAELDRKFPISNKELRARKKAFYSWLNSQRRR